MTLHLIPLNFLIYGEKFIYFFISVLEACFHFNCELFMYSVQANVSLSTEDISLPLGQYTVDRKRRPLPT
jgi:hypothetical protein